VRKKVALLTIRLVLVKRTVHCSYIKVLQKIILALKIRQKFGRCLETFRQPEPGGTTGDLAAIICFLTQYQTWWVNNQLACTATYSVFFSEFKCPDLHNRIAQKFWLQFAIWTWSSRSNSDLGRPNSDLSRSNSDLGRSNSDLSRSNSDLSRSN
jgi:hypothetical protein